MTRERGEGRVASLAFARRGRRTCRLRARSRSRSARLRGIWSEGGDALQAISCILGNRVLLDSSERVVGRAEEARRARARLAEVRRRFLFVLLFRSSLLAPFGVGGPAFARRVARSFLGG